MVGGSLLFVLLWYLVVVIVLFFFKQKTAYEMRISDWSSDVCSSDLAALGDEAHAALRHRRLDDRHVVFEADAEVGVVPADPRPPHLGLQETKVAADQIGRAPCRERVCQYV